MAGITSYGDEKKADIVTVDTMQLSPQGPGAVYLSHPLLGISLPSKPCLFSPQHQVLPGNLPGEGREGRSLSSVLLLT